MLFFYVHILKERRKIMKAKDQRQRFAITPGQTFGMLTVIEVTNKRTKAGSTVWKCQCKCNKTVEASSKALIHDNKTSCGCQNSIRIPKLAVKSGKRYGKYVALAPTEERDRGCVIWLCRYENAPNRLNLALVSTRILTRLKP